MSNLNSRQLLELYKAGDSQAATAIFDRYVARLVALARVRIGPAMQRRVDPDDVVQSAYRSFFMHAGDGQYQLNHSGDLWRLLASITLHKLYRQIELHTSARRSVHGEQGDDLAVANLEAPEPSAAEVVALVEELRLATSALSPDELQVLTASLQGNAIEQICDAIGKSARTVRRLLAEARRKIEQRLLTDKPAQTPRPSTIEPQAPLRFSDYTLERLLGAGGMGKVFRAREKTSGKKVAIKALHKSRQTDRRAADQFVQEAHILARLSHPHIVGVHGLGCFPAGGYFLVMDLVDGVDLQRRIDRGPLPIAEAKHIGAQVAAAIQYAHDQGVVHCDLKPANVLVDDNGQAWVTDFGFARLLAAGPSKAAALGGTAGYIAPEILRGQCQPTSTGDIYAFGRLLWTMLAGNAPFDPNDRLPTDDPHANVHALCRRCLAADPNKRIQSAKEVRQEIQNL